METTDVSCAWAELNAADFGVPQVREFSSWRRPRTSGVRISYSFEGRFSWNKQQETGRNGGSMLPLTGRMAPEPACRGSRLETRLQTCPLGRRRAESSNNHWSIQGARAILWPHGELLDWPSKTLKAGHGVDSKLAATTRYGTIPRDGADRLSDRHQSREHDQM